MDQSEHIDMRTAVTIIRSSWIVIIVATVLGGCITGLIAKNKSPIYQARSILLVGQNEGIAELDAVTAINQTMPSLARMASDRVVIEKAISRLNEPTANVDPLAPQVTAIVPLDTQNIEIVVTRSDPKSAAKYSNAVAQAFSEMVNSGSTKRSSITATVWQKAIPPSSPIGPDIRMNISVGLMLGFLAGILFAFARWQLGSRWRNDQTVEQALNNPVLGTTPYSARDMPICKCMRDTEETHV